MALDGRGRHGPADSVPAGPGLGGDRNRAAKAQADPRAVVRTRKCGRLRRLCSDTDCDRLRLAGSGLDRSAPWGPADASPGNHSSAREGASRSEHVCALVAALLGRARDSSQRARAEVRLVIAPFPPKGWATPAFRGCIWLLRPRKPMSTSKTLRGEKGEPEMIQTLAARIQLAKMQAEEGQALVEYALILALISVVAIGVLEVIGVRLTDVLGRLGNDL